MNALATQLGEATPLVWLVPLLPLLAAAAIAMRMLFCREHGDRQEPFTAGLASAPRSARCFCSCSSTWRRWSTACRKRCAPANGWRSA
jgi:hypothetical protein